MKGVNFLKKTLFKSFTWKFQVPLKPLPQIFGEKVYFDTFARKCHSNQPMKLLLSDIDTFNWTCQVPS